MKAIQLLFDEDMLREVDLAAKRQDTDRSKVIRAAVARMLRELQLRELEERDIRAYQEHPQTPAEYEPWQKLQRWPRE